MFKSKVKIPYYKNKIPVKPWRESTMNINSEQTQPPTQATNLELMLLPVSINFNRKRS